MKYECSSLPDFRRTTFLLLVALLACMIATDKALAQGNLIIFGDVRMRTSDGAAANESITIILISVTGGEIGRQIVSNRGRYRFSNLKAGDYELAIEVQGGEIGRMRNIVLGGLSNSPYGFQYDLEFEWKRATTKAVTGVLSAAEVYVRSAANQSLFLKAQAAAEKKKYDQAATLLTQLVENDGADFQAWSILGSIYVMQQKPEEAERAYLTALDVKPAFSLALLNLGRLRSSQKRFAEAIEPLIAAVAVQPQSAEINLLVGEAYLQIKKGSKAIPYLNEAARLGRPEARLRLGWLYNAAGLKSLAVTEYEQFLKQKPDYSDRTKLEEYIRANKQDGERQ